ncbi:class I SAM-dependent methyltransferase, partial [Candidatus Woesearchaeota archaeon]|nr:class I SAM-dependent methyltransferase [Candidatus Woesearchaeota archaeon]
MNDPPDIEVLIDQFIKKVNLNIRVCEPTEEVDGNDAVRYNHACDYPENSDPGLVVEELRQSLRGSIGGKKVLEIGPGPGYLCRELMNAGAALVVGVDPSVEMIAHVNEKYKTEICQGRMNFVSASVYSLPLELNNGFDVVVCQNSLHQLFNPLSALTGMVNAAKGDGEVHVFDFRRDIGTELLTRRIS